MKGQIFESKNNHIKSNSQKCDKNLAQKLSRLISSYDVTQKQKNPFYNSNYTGNKSNISTGSASISRGGLTILQPIPRPLNL